MTLHGSTFMRVAKRLLRSPSTPSPPANRCRYFKEDSAAEISARDQLVTGYIKLKLNSTAGLPLDERDAQGASAGDMTFEEVSQGGKIRSERSISITSRTDNEPQRGNPGNGSLSVGQGIHPSLEP